MNCQNKKYTFILLLVILVIYSYDLQLCLAKDKMNGPNKPQPKNRMETYGTGDNFFLNIYQNWISPVKGGNTCPMYPACSQYAKTVFQFLPWYEAYTNSLERLLRCGNELYLYPVIRVNGQVYWYDPVIIDSPNRKLSQVNND